MKNFLTGNGFILVPRVTTTERNALTAANGMLVYDTTLKSFYKYENDVWSSFGGGSAAWGGITGTLSSQTDLQNALNAKENSITAGTTAQYFRGDKTFQTLDKTAVGLGNVDNTSDLNKPISTATQTSLDNRPVLISTATASTTATIDFTLPSGYKSFDIRVISLVPSTDNVGMWLRVSTDGGSTFAAGASDYIYQRYYQNGSSSFPSLSAADSKIITLGGNIGNGTGRYFNSIIKVFDHSNASTYKNITVEFYTYRSDSIYSFGFVNGVYLYNTAINAIRILMSSGNIASGTFELWGYK